MNTTARGRESHTNAERNGIQNFEQKGDTIKVVGAGNGGGGNVLWSVVMMTDCAARGILPRRAAASATISNAALKVRGENPDPDH
jgi:hypothetical protein